MSPNLLALIGVVSLVFQVALCVLLVWFLVRAGRVLKTSSTDGSGQRHRDERDER
jgi:hypothetical protein